MSQADQILAHLQSGKSLTQREADNLFGCWRLSGRIWDLRQEGHNIHTEIITTPKGKHPGRYTYISGPQQVAA